MPPFGDSILILAQGFIVFASFGILAFGTYRLSKKRILSLRLKVGMSVCALIILGVIVSMIFDSGIEYNPYISSEKELVGRYSKGNRNLRLNADGTYLATGFPDFSSGRWSNFDWNLTLSGAPLDKPRIVSRNGVLYIAPYYAGVDGPDGILLRKESLD